jgi:hypothetical protein
MAHHIPTGYAYTNSTNEEATEADKAILDQTTDLAKAIETLDPHDFFNSAIDKLRDSLHGESLQYSTVTSQCDSFEKNPNLVRKCINIQPQYIFPHGLNEYPTTLEPTFQVFAAGFDATIATLKSTANAWMHLGHQLTCFKHRLDRVRSLTSQLIHTLGHVHIRYYTMKHRDKASTPTVHFSTKPTPDEITLATHAVFGLLKRIDLQMLEYLDINRTKLLEFFQASHPLGDPTALPEEQKKAIEYATITMLSYIKPATYLFSKGQTDQAEAQKFRASVRAGYEASLTTDSTSAVSEVLDTAHLPQDNKTLEDAVTPVVHNVLNQRDQKAQNEQHSRNTDTRGNQKTAHFARQDHKKAYKGKNPKAKHPKGSGDRQPRPAGPHPKGNTKTGQLKGILKTTFTDQEDSQTPQHGHNKGAKGAKQRKRQPGPHSGPPPQPGPKPGPQTGSQPAPTPGPKQPPHHRGGKSKKHRKPGKGPRHT